MGQRGLFITLEGTEGVGKSTAMALIAEVLTGLNQEYLLSREPGGTPLAELIRSLLVSSHDEPMSPLTELLLVFAARAQHLEQRIQPALERGDWVVCDRFTDATFAYQGAARGLGAERVAQLETLVQGDLRPDLTILLDAPVKTGMARVGKRGNLDRFESEKLAFFEKVRQCYLQRASAEPQRFIVVDAARPQQRVEEDLRSIFEGLARARGNL